MKSKYLGFMLFLLAAVCGAALLLAPRQGTVAELYLDGKRLTTVDLSRLEGPLEIPIGAGNVALAEPGRVRMLTADCPDKLCVHRGWSASAAKPIVCLPNRVVILVGGGDGLDAVLS